MDESCDIRNKRWRARFLAAAIFCCCLSAPAFAVTSSDAVLTVNQSTQLNWGTLQIPSGSTTSTIAGTSSGTTSGTGTLLYGTTSSGEYTIRESVSRRQSGCTSLTINVMSASCAPGCTIGSWTGKYGATTLRGAPPWTGLNAPGIESKKLYLGATLTYTSAAKAGSYTPAFTISTNCNNTSTISDFPQTAAVGFDIPLSIDTVTDVNIGHVQALTTGTYTINTSGTVTATGAGQWINGPTSVGNLLIHGSATQTISISAGSYVAGGSGGGVSLSAATCAYNGGAPAPCSLATQAAPTAAGKTLLLGVTVTVGNKTQADGSTATPSFTVTVTYS